MESRSSLGCAPSETADGQETLLSGRKGGLSSCSSWVWAGPFFGSSGSTVGWDHNIYSNVKVAIRLSEVELDNLLAVLPDMVGSLGAIWGSRLGLGPRLQVGPGLGPK